MNGKIKKAFCPPQVLEKNPIFDYIKWIIFQSFGEFVIERTAENGGNKVYTSYLQQSTFSFILSSFLLIDSLLPCFLLSSSFFVFLRLSSFLLSLVILSLRGVSYEECAEDYKSGALHPGDVKTAVAKAINRLIQPVRDHFAKNEDAKKLLNQVRQYKSTR